MARQKTVRSKARKEVNGDGVVIDFRYRVRALQYHIYFPTPLLNLRIRSSSILHMKGLAPYDRIDSRDSRLGRFLTERL